MATPTSAIQRPDLGLALEEFDLEMSRAGFIGMQVFPVIDVALATANFSRVKLEQLLIDIDTARAPGAGYSRDDFEFTQDNYTTSEQGAEAVNDDSEQKIYAYTIDSEVIAAKRARDRVLRNFEKRVSAKVIDTAVWTGSSLTTTVGTAWSSKSSCTPVDDVDAAAIKIYNNFGIKPNSLILTWKDFKNLRQSDQIISRIKYSGRDDPKNITCQMLAEVFDIEQVLVGDGQYNSAKKGQTASLSTIWPTGSAMLAKLAKSNDLREPCLGRTFHFTADGSSIGGTVEEYREERVRGSVFRVRHHTGEKVINKECGHLLTGI